MNECLGLGRENKSGVDSVSDVVVSRKPGFDMKHNINMSFTTQKGVKVFNLKVYQFSDVVNHSNMLILCSKRKKNFSPKSTVCDRKLYGKCGFNFEEQKHFNTSGWGTEASTLFMVINQDHSFDKNLMIRNDTLTDLFKLKLWQKLEAIATRTCSTINVYWTRLVTQPPPGIIGKIEPVHKY